MDTPVRLMTCMPMYGVCSAAWKVLTASDQLFTCVVQGSDYFTTELARLQRLLEGGKLSPTKLSEISRKISVLGAFQNDEDITAEE